MRIQTHQQGHYTISPNFSEKQTQKQARSNNFSREKAGKGNTNAFFPLKDNTFFLGAKVAGIFRMMLRMGKLPEIHV